MGNPKRKVLTAINISSQELDATVWEHFSWKDHQQLGDISITPITELKFHWHE